MGGTKTSIQQSPVTAAPSASQSAEDIYKARLQYDPQTAQLEYNLAEQYSPLYGALYQQTIDKQFPGLTGLQETGISQAQERLNNPFAYTASEQDYLNQSRDQARQNLQRSMRERANLGGGLYGGRNIALENQGMGQLEQAFSGEDVNRRLQASQQAQQSALSYLQILYPQITNTPAVSQSTSPDANTLYNAMFQASQPESYLQQGQSSPLWGLAGSVAGGVGTGWANNYFK